MKVSLRRWPLWLAAGIIILLGATFWLHWPQILLQSVLWQRELHQQMTQLLQQVAAQPQ